MKAFLSILALCLACITSSLAVPTTSSVDVGQGCVEPSLANPLKTIQLQRRHELELEKRQFQLIPIAVGLWLSIAAESAAEPIIDAVAKSLNAVFGKDPTPWDGGADKCTISYSTHGGAQCQATINAKGVKSARPSNNWNVCPWINPASTAPPIQYFSDKGLGDYSIQFTATDKVAWADIPGTEKCIMEGLCNPRITFYRKDHSIILDTWMSLGDPTQGQYFGDFGGLCGNGPIKNQFKSNGMVMGYDCGVPCEGATDIPSTEGS
ncbi:hypothetical protein CPB83DRAFT_646794 [Crepidotus variabilis]|uniref:Uncharacterized protein n=1 Tax=Crepidotus variabilis TaxID=179855 RepID=A0A9P6E7J7_9AGAR|nr:hypothetical protein CPB83DRAFT_646794 [Crepidotus variabilis]